jgi:mono/diheme cytochrome c family protein
MPQSSSGERLGKEQAMRHVIVNRIVVVFGAVLIAAVALFAWAATRPVPPAAPEQPGPTGADLFARHCAMCHDAEDVGASHRAAEDRDAAVEGFREFLADHYGPSPEGIALIVSHVMDAGER